MFEIKSGRIKPKKEPMFGKKPYAGKDRNRTGKKSVTVTAARIKPKFDGSNQKEISPDDRVYLKWLKEFAVYPCFVCGGFNGIEWHHVKEVSSDVKNHKRLIPLCGVEHHRLGSVLSAHGTPKKWRETYLMEEQEEAADKIYADYLAEKS